MRHFRTIARMVLGVLVAIALGAAAGCTSGGTSAGGGHGSSGGSGAHSHQGTTSTAKPVPAGKQKKIPASKLYKVTTQPGTSKGYVGAARDVKLTDCASRKGVSNFAGRVSNPTSARQSYRIYVAVTNKSKTLGIAEADVRSLAGKATATWKGHLGEGVHGATCVLRVERQQA